MTGGYRSDIQSELGPLRSVVVATARIPAHRAIPAKGVDQLLETRRVPARFAPPGALSAPDQAAGLAPAEAIPAGSYVLGSQLREAGGARRGPGHPRIAPGRKPVEITVAGAEALAAAGADPVGTRVDVVVTTEPGPGGGSGRTYLAAKKVRLLGLSHAGEATASDYGPPSDPDRWTATLALTKAQALRLIQAESFARGVRLIEH